MSDLLVLGAGPAGLMAAREAALAGHRCTVLEASDRVGGMAASFEVAGQRVDFGSHRLHPATPPGLLATIEELLGGDLQVRPRAGRLRFDGRWVGFPLRAGDLIRSLPVPLTARLVADAVMTTGQRRPPAPAATFPDEVTARLGPTVSERFYVPYARKLYGLDPTELDPELARRRVSAASPLAVAGRLLAAGRPRGRTFLYPRRGFGQIVERLAEAAVDAGVDIRLDHPVDRVGIGGDEVTVTAGRRYRQDASLVLSTIPVGHLAGLVDPPPPAEVTKAVSGARTRAVLLLYLVLDRPRYTRFDAHYLPGPNTVVARLSEPKNYRDGDDPPDRTVLCAEIPCWPDELADASSDDLLGRVVDDLGRLGLPPADPVAVELRGLRSVYPIFDLAGRGHRATIDRWARGLDRVVTLGRQGLQVIDNLHHVLAMGAAAAAAIDGDGRLRRARWERSLAAFADHVVED